MSELLLEIFSEEIPARMQKQAAADLSRLVGDALKAQGLEAKTLDGFAGPRRLVLSATCLPKAQPDTTEERKGPQVGAPEQAIQGFLRAAGLTHLDQAEKRELPPKGTFYFAVSKKKGRPTADVVKDIIEAALPQLPWPKSMRWADKPTRWVRPLHSIVCVLDGNIVPVSFGGLVAGNTTRGHRFLAPAAITVKDLAGYKAALRKAHVLVDAADRAAVIEAELKKLAAKEGLTVKADPGLLAEVAGLVEWPVPLLGTIDAAFMDVPAEVLTSAMRKHQKYFALNTKGGKLANRFGVVANMIAKDGGKAIVAGNEKVLRARLSDAKFFWDQDKKRTLESRLPKLEERIFQAKLGTMRAKVDRIAALAAYLAHPVGADVDAVRRAALLCKADLSSDMVGEFPDLQGVMGRYYALAHNEPANVADAIADHYSPLGPSDSVPTKPVSIAVSLADKIDSLVGFFAINEKPTGSKDPYALRRAALGVIRIVLENKLRLPLLAAFEFALGGYNGLTPDNAREKIAREVLDFFADRLKAHLRDKGTRHDLVSAVFARGDEDDLVRLMARVDALTAFVTSDDGVNLLAAYRRAGNILRIEEKKDATSYLRGLDAGAAGAEEAEALRVALGHVAGPSDAKRAAEDYVGAMAELAKLRRPVDIFFDKVMVNTDNADHRIGRLILLAHVVKIMDHVADFSKVEA
ncbi:MAG: glycine--tRNA ligase subunit beta [Rhodospirillaceae bacterium]|nr:glycine--tRNA ligase subunit beta [Rhodospirillaceae bacterium]